jgi:hypothetical protein
MELFVEAAGWFAEHYLHWDSESCNVVGLENFSIERAIAIKPGSALDICIQLIDADETSCSKSMKVSIVSKRINFYGKTIGKRLNAYCKILFSDTLPGTHFVEIPHCKLKYYHLDPQVYYNFYFPSLGPLFQSGTGRFAVSEDINTLIGEYDCRNSEKFFIEGQESKFIISPLGYDSCLQYTVFLSRILTIKGRLPVSAKKINIIRNHAESGRYRVGVKCLKIDDEIMLADIWLFDDEGIIVMLAEEFAVKRSPFHRYDDKQAFEELLEENRVEEMEW